MDKSEWTIKEEEIIEFAKEKNLKYFKTSAKTKEGINEGFEHIINDAYERIKARAENEQKIELKKKESNEVGEKTGCFGKKKKKKKIDDKNTKKY